MKAAQNRRKQQPVWSEVQGPLLEKQKNGGCIVRRRLMKKTLIAALA